MFILTQTVAKNYITNTIFHPTRSEITVTLSASQSLMLSKTTSKLLLTPIVMESKWLDLSSTQTTPWVYLGTPC